MVRTRKTFLIRSIVPAHLGLLALCAFSAPLITQAQTPSQLPAPTQPAPPAVTSILYVNPSTGSDQATAGKTAAVPYRSLTFALSQATAGTVVQLAPGNYTAPNETFPIVIPTGVIVRGDESTKGQGIVVQGTGRYLSRAEAGQNVAIRAGEGSEIRGITVTNVETRGTGIWVEDVDCTIANNTFTKNNREGVFVTGNSNPVVADNVFSENLGNGMAVSDGARGLIRNNLFIKTGFGLAIGEKSIPRLEGNQIRENTAGIYMSGSTRPILRNNVITDSQGDGIIARDSSFPDLGTADSLGNNTIRNNGRDTKLKPRGIDLNNRTSNTFQAIGNNIDPKQIAGRVQFVAGGTNTAFSDIQGHWAQQYIQALASQAIITGFPDGTFKPNDPVTRAQFATIVAKAFSPAPRNPAVNFTDVRSNFWGFGAIQTASRAGFMAGFPGGAFRPDQRIPKVQALVALSNGLQYGAGDPSVLSRFQDAAAIPSWAASPIAAATQRQIVVNYPTVGQLNPGREATRAEVAAFIYQALVAQGKAQAIPSPYVVGVR